MVQYGASTVYKSRILVTLKDFEEKISDKKPEGEEKQPSFDQSPDFFNRLVGYL